MNNPRTASSLSRGKLVLSLLARNLAETRSFYETIGFRHSGGDDAAGWIELSFGGAVLQFYRDPPIGTLHAPSLSGTIYVHVEDADALSRPISNQVPFEWGPETMDYGMREFAVRDPNGYFVAFASPAAK
jgi:uncharacterized glyoxalase superfamily protein PhnB